MNQRRARTVKRTAAVAAAMMLVGLVWSGVASAEVRTSVPTQASSTSGDSTSASSTSSDSSTGSSTSSTGSTGVLGDVAGTQIGTSVASSLSTASTSGTSTTGTSTLGVIGTSVTSVGTVAGTSVLSTISVAGSTASTSSTSSTGSTIETIYAPPQYYGGNYGHRYYGRYHDSGCGCDRYASPNYTPQVVVATQVASVPKGGVNTGDGSFQ